MASKSSKGLKLNNMPNTCTASELILLKEMFENVTMNPGVLETLQIMKKNKVLEQHSYAINPPSKNAQKPLWQTYVYDATRPHNRRRIKAVSEAKLLEKLYTLYFDNETYTLRTFFSVWVEKRKTEGLAAKTIKRNVEHWKKYYSTNPISTVLLHKLDAEMIEDFFHISIVEYQMTTKELNNMKAIMVDMLRLAVVRKLIPYNPFKDVKVKTNNCMPPKKKSDEEGIFQPDEIIKIFDALNRDIVENPEVTDSYAIFLLFKLGLRISEIVAIKEEDVSFSNGELYIHRMERTFEDEAGNYYLDVVNYTKKHSSHGIRYISLSKYELDLLKTVIQTNRKYSYNDDGFIFCDESGRTKCSEIDARLSKVCRWSGIKGKTSHTIRRTIATELYDLYNDIKLVKDFLGHSDEKITWGYIYRSDEKRRAYKHLTADISSMNGLRRPKEAHTTVNKKTPKPLISQRF